MALPPPPVGLNLNETRVPAILGLSISTFILATVAVGLRIICRRILKLKLWWDDWLVFVALAAGGGMLFLVDIWMVPHGFGEHVWAGPKDAVEVWAEGLFIEEILYTICLCTCKFSILLFYWRLFNCSSSIRIPIYILSGIVTGWAISVIFVTIFQCIPPSAFWLKYDVDISPSTKASYKCNVNDTKFFIGNSVANFLTDIAILSLPSRAVWQLQLPTSKKIAVLGIMMLGVFVVAVSIVRFYYVNTEDLTSPDITWDFFFGQIWSNVECYIGITCACLPSMGPLFNLIAGGSLRSQGPANQTYRLGSGNTRNRVGWKSPWNSKSDSQWSQTLRDRGSTGDDDTIELHPNISSDIEARLPRKHENSNNSVDQNHNSDLAIPSRPQTYHRGE